MKMYVKIRKTKGYIQNQGCWIVFMIDRLRFNDKDSRYRLNSTKIIKFL